MSISKVLLISFDAVQSDAERVVREHLEENQTIKLFDFSNIHHEYSKQPEYAEKLKLLLDDAKLALLITPSNIHDLMVFNKFSSTLRNVGLDEKAANVFCKFLDIEMDKSSKETKIIFVDVGDNIDLPESFVGANHLELLTSDGINRCALNDIFSKCKRGLRTTFPVESKKKTKSAKKEICEIM